MSNSIFNFLFLYKNIRNNDHTSQVFSLLFLAYRTYHSDTSGCGALVDKLSIINDLLQHMLQHRSIIRAKNLLKSKLRI